MPVYEFACGSCGERFDRLQGLRESPPACPSCGSEDVRRLISLIAGLHGARGGTTSGGCACGGACACAR